MPLEKRDELGPIPPDIAQVLKPHFERGPRPAVRANIGIASAVLLVVPDAATPERFTAMSAVVHAIRSARVPSLVCDGNSNLEEVARWRRGLPATSDATRIMVTGPRATRWPEGEAVARRLVSAIAIIGEVAEDGLSTHPRSDSSVATFGTRTSWASRSIASCFYRSTLTAPLSTSIAGG